MDFTVKVQKMKQSQFLTVENSIRINSLIVTLHS